jgi:enterochelin esterase family protein
MKRGRVEVHDFESRVLAGNAAGDPPVRRVPVWLPPSYDAERSRRYPLLLVLSGFTGRGRMLLNDNAWSPPLDERLDRLVEAGCGEMVVVLPDCFTRFGGSQYVNSTATGRYADHLLDELVPWADATFRTMASREHRGVAGKSSGGFGAMTLGMTRPDVFSALACHSGDMYFEYCYRPDIPKTCSVIQEAGGARAFLDAFERAPQKSKDQFLALNILAMAACYSPDLKAELGVALPFDLATGAFRDDVWRRWLGFDPLLRLPRCEPALRSLRLLYLDCGTHDEFHLHHGARLFVRELASRGIAHHYEEFDDAHMNVSYRYDTSLPLLAKALGA